MIVVMCLLHISYLSLCAAVMLFNGVDLVIKEAVEVTRRGQTFWNVPWPFLSIADSIDGLDIYVRKKHARLTFSPPNIKRSIHRFLRPPHSILGE